MALKDYYNKLPKGSDPKREFRKKLSKECGVTVSTVFRWLSGDVIPDKLKQQRIAEITGIPARTLFPKEPILIHDRDQNRQPAFDILFTSVRDSLFSLDELKDFEDIISRGLSKESDFREGLITPEGEDLWSLEKTEDEDGFRVYAFMHEGSRYFFGTGAELFILSRVLGLRNFLKSWLNQQPKEHDEII